MKYIVIFDNYFHWINLHYVEKNNTILSLFYKRFDNYPKNF